MEKRFPSTSPALKAVRVMRLTSDRVRYLLVSLWLMFAGFSFFAITSCKSTSSYNTTDRVSSDPETRLDRGWPKTNLRWEEKSYPPLRVSYPQIHGAEFVNEDNLCKVCHKSHVESFEYNVHRNNSCESCHGPASRHLETRGKEAGTILSFKKMKRAERAEVCMKCHAKDACTPSAQWRTSAHAHHGVTCTDCHKNHYNVPEGTPTNTVDNVATLDKFETEWKTFMASQRTSSDTQVKDEKKNLPSLRGTSNNLGAVAPQVCYRCHSEKQELELVAHPHQVNGKHGFNCTTCHNAHGNVLAESRRDLCVECHKGSPTASWHSSIHDQAGVACTDCHNPHPRTHVQQVANINHTSIQRNKRLPMSVNEQQACAKCHPKIFGLMQLPSHHPLKEGKMSCSDCHDPHGQAEGNLKAETVNMTCYKCHADKEGPFVYEHPPVNENCSICHNPHGTVANNLLHQPPSFLCLRCHTGHRSPPADHFLIGTSDLDGNSFQRPILYTKCTQCHGQVHGSDHPSQQRAGALLR